MKDTCLHAFHRHWIYEVVITAGNVDRVAVGPFGMWTDDGMTLKGSFFKGSSTLQAIEAHRCFVVNPVDDPVVLHAALNRRDSLEFEFLSSGDAAGCPVLAGIPSWLAMRVTHLDDTGDMVLLDAEVVGHGAIHSAPLVNRAKGLFLESLVLSTRCALIGQAAVEQLRENVRVIAKVAPGSRYEKAVRELLALVTESR
ncbi:DUF447 family protein [Pseudodesulfovibrio sp. JC047]|uniref:DUF447 domain-containing protein n=1 Tax=Pseudodesulfovibrio sp. JC047 TaxID=2683199 RepID=UPI0013D7D5E1|nr:DUF447 domain-containing protein [Pseudodesulfovibrio sp. JC047]NDV19440.1 DUF447 family protein [Pseudodesulfovibrio sp. JC047]